MFKKNTMSETNNVILFYQTYHHFAFKRKSKRNLQVKIHEGPSACEYAVQTELDFVNKWE